MSLLAGNSDNHSMIKQLLKISSSLSTEKDIDQILENILTTSMRLANADAGTLYRVTDDQYLTFQIVHTKSKGVHLGGKSVNSISMPPIPLFSLGCLPDLTKTVSYAYHQNKTVNIKDAYNTEEFNFTGTHEFDALNDYRSVSILNIPMRDHESQIIGILQLINALDPASGAITTFSDESVEIIEALSSQAAIAITNRTLVLHLEDLFESFITMINHAIDDKSAHTGDHCNRVPFLTLALAQAVNQHQSGPLKSFSISQASLQELKVASLLHDCGKITTPVHIVDKATKLEIIFDRIQLIEMRVEIIMRDVQLNFANKLITSEAAIEAQQQLINDFHFLCHCNIGGESMKDADMQRVRDIANSYIWRDFSGLNHFFLNEDEVANLTIKSGTLNHSERKVINRHIELTISMLEKLNWPKHLRNVPEYAGGHHERMDGMGYPRGLKRNEMSIPARCMGIADIFEALTAKDRPYKKGKALSESLHILGKMKLNQHIDPDLFDIFMWSKVYEQYAEQFMDKSQIDAVDVNLVPGYVPPPLD